MLDLKFIQKNLDLVKRAAKSKNIDVDLDKLLDLDTKRREIQFNLDNKRQEHNALSQKIPTAGKEQKESLIEQSTQTKEEIKTLESDLKPILEQLDKLILQVPQVPHESVPEGKSDEDNEEIKSWGKKPSFNFAPKDHIELMTTLDMVDFEQGSKVHGFRGYYLKNDGALLSWAIWNYAQSFFLKKGFQAMIAPAIVKKENFYGTGHLPGDEQDLFKTQDNDYLSGTAEVPAMAYFANQTIEEEKKILAFSPCYRREAGSYGKDVKGLIRVHEFYKLEQVMLCEPDEEKSIQYHQWLNRNTEEFIESLKIPYQTVINCTGDLGLGQRKKYDINLWVPQEKKYREISSASYFNDFQTRRFKIKFKGKDGKTEFAHSLNCTAIPTPRILVSLVENFQTERGTIKVPKALQKYLGKKEIKP